jgi:hypothetical protein
MQRIVLSRGAKMRRNTRFRAIVALGLVVLVAVGVTSTVTAGSRVPAKFEPADGSIYTGAGQSTEAIVQMVNSGDPNRQPMLVAAYDFLTPATIANVNVYQPQEDILQAHNYYPGSILQIGMELPQFDTTELAAVGSGKYDNWLRGMANTYKNLNQKIFLRIGYEFDGKWNAYDPTAYVSAYRRIVDIFRSQKVNNVAFVWNSYTPDADSSNPTATGYRYNGNPMFAWYPGDAYVDWFSFDDWTKGFNSTWFMAQAALHGKPVIMGESSYTESLDTGYTFNQWVGPFFKSVRSSGVKGFQYINWNWPIYPVSDWSAWADGKYTSDPTSVAAYNTELKKSTYIVRDKTYFNPMALWVGAARATAPGVSEATWTKSEDESSAQPGYDYTPIAATSSYSDGWGTYWSNASGTSQLTVDVTVPSNSAGMVVLGGYASYLGQDVYIGSREVLSGVQPTGPVKFAFTAADSASGTLAVTIVEPDTSSIHINSIGIQKVSRAAPAAPKKLKVTAVTTSSVSLAWKAIAGTSVYNIYRNGQLVGTSPNRRFTDSNLPFGHSYQYAVSAVDTKSGEGYPSATVPARTSGTLVDPLDTFSLTDAHAANIALDTTSPATFGGDTSRLVRTDANDGWFTYHADGLSQFSFVLYYQDGANSVYANVAPTSSGPYSNVDLTMSTPVALASGWYSATYTATVPAGNSVVGIHMQGGDGSSFANQEIGQVTLTN